MTAKLLEERERWNGIHETGRLDTLSFQIGTSYLQISEVKPALHEDNKGKIILLPMPDDNVSGSKREAETLDALVKKKAKVEWSYAACKFGTFSERQLNEHLQGRKHKNEESKMPTTRKISLNSHHWKKNESKLDTNIRMGEKLVKRRRRAHKRSKKRASQSHIVEQNRGTGRRMIPATIDYPAMMRSI